MKRILSILLSLTLCLTLLPAAVQVQAASVDDLSYEIIDGQVTITDCNEYASGGLTIPDTINGYPVTGIGDDAFSYCFSLTSVTIPDSVTSIGDRAFDSCTSLTGIIVSENNPSYSSDSLGFVYTKDKATLIQAPGAISGTYTIPDSVTSIGNDAFSRCESLTSVTIPDSVTSIGDRAFYNCESLTSVTIGDSVTSMGNMAFFGTSLQYNVYGAGEYLGNDENPYVVLMDTINTAITAIDIHSDTKLIWCNAFSNCSSLTNVTIPDSVNSIGNYAFYGCSSLTSVTIPDSVTSIGDGAFSHCTNLTSVMIPDSVTSIGDDAFAYCTSLTSVTIGDSVTSIGDYAFFNCYRLTSVAIPDSVTSIGDSAFSNCSSLTSVTIPDSVTSIGDDAFSFCYRLTSVAIPDSVTSIGDRAFHSCTSLTGIIVSENNPSYSSDSLGFVYTKDKATLIQAPGAITGTYTIPDSVTSIGNSAFSNCDGLTSVAIPDSVTSIGDYAFYGCESLTSVTIGDSVTSIGDSVFRSCTSLTSVTIGDSVTSIGDYAFSNCRSLTSIYFAGNAPSIVNGAFYGVSATAYYHAGTSGWANAAPENWTDDSGWITLQEADHIWSSFTYDNNHTCTVDGTERAVCLTCGETDVRRVEGTAEHRLVYTSNNDATCTQDGTKTVKCKLCGIAETVTDEGSALGHAYSDYVSNNDATCTQDGTKSSVCANCGDRKTVTDEGSALGHSFTSYIFDDNYTCTLDGTETAKCDRCDETHLRVVPGTAAHRYVDGTCLYCDKPEPGPNCAGLTGKLTAFGEGVTQLTLTPVGETIPAATQTTTDGSYSFRVAPGDYILAVSQEGAATRTYTVTLTEGETALDVKLQQPGDVTGDGRLNVGDVVKIYAHSKGTAEFTDDYQLLCADYNGDGRINVGDVVRIYALIRSQ